MSLNLRSKGRCLSQNWKINKDWELQDSIIVIDAIAQSHSVDHWSATDNRSIAQFKSILIQVAAGAVIQSTGQSITTALVATAHSVAILYIITDIVAAQCSKHLNCRFSHISSSSSAVLSEGWRWAEHDAVCDSVSVFCKCVDVQTGPFDYILCPSHLVLSLCTLYIESARSYVFKAELVSGLLQKLDRVSGTIY